MSTPDATPDRPLPAVDDLPRTRDGGVEPAAVSAALDVYRRSAMQLSAQLRVLKAAAATPAPKPVLAEPVGHAARMNAMRILRAAAEFADTIEREAEKAASSRLAQIDIDVEQRQRDVVEAETRVKAVRDEFVTNRDELLRRARDEANQLLEKARSDASAAVRAAEAHANELRETARRDAEELTRSVQGDVEETLDWARAEASAILARVQEVSRQLLRAAALGPERVEEVAAAIARAAHAATVAAKGPEPSLVAPLYEDIASPRDQAAPRASQPVDDPGPPRAPEPGAA